MQIAQTNDLRYLRVSNDKLLTRMFMTTETPTEKDVLSGKNATELWAEGVQNWNAWAESSPNTDVSFKEVDFHQFSLGGRINFIGFHFPAKGKVTFEKASFGRGGVDFSNAQFGDGGVSFVNVNFQTGDVIFKDVNFGDGYVDFRNTHFGGGVVKFVGAKFGNKLTSFRGANFGTGNVYFTDANFGNDNLDFSSTRFGGDNVYFVNIHMGNGELYFGDADFGKAHVTFEAAQFGVGVAYFKRTKFASATFENAIFGQNGANFEYAEFTGSANFELLKITDDNNQAHFNFRFATFSKSCNFSTDSLLNSIPDFTGTKNTNHFVLTGLKCQLQTCRHKMTRRAIDPIDAERLCRLKELAESNKDHRKALQFHANEMRAKRWHQYGWFASVLDLMFDKISNYGQSLMRPALALIFIIAAMTVYTVGYQLPFSAKWSEYLLWINNMESISTTTWIDGFIASLSHVIPFIGGMQGHGKEAMTTLRPLLPHHYGAIALIFSLPAFALLFLIGLALRNRFRL